MRKKARRKTILIDGIRYYDDKPDTCRKCFFWKNRKVGCVLGTQNCYYLAEAVKTEQEKKCEGCCYAKGHPCVSAVCYKELDAWLRASRANRAKEEGAANEYDLTQHPNYKYTADYDKKLTFDIEKYLSTKAKLHPKDEFFVMEEEK